MAKDSISHRSYRVRETVETEADISADRPAILRSLFAVLVFALASLSIVCAPTAAKEQVPPFVARGMPGPAHQAMAPLIGSWNAELSIYGTMGRSPNLPPIVSRDIRTTRVWVADGQYIEDTTEGTVDGQPYWRRGWLGYSNLDRRYEWVTIAPRVPMMIYHSKAGTKMPIELTGFFTDQGVVNEQTVGKRVAQRTVFRVESNDQHVSELYFTPPGGKEQLAMRIVYTRVK